MKKLAKVEARKLAKITVVAPDSAERAIEGLLIFDARCLDGATQRELLRLMPGLVRMRRLWKVRYLKYGCESCHKKEATYGAGGFCNRCAERIYKWLRYQFHKVGADRNLLEETGALTLRLDAAQRLLNGGKR